jgi:hypothetical protein
MAVSDHVPTREVSYNHEQICLLEAFYPQNQAYNFQATVHLRGPLDVACLERAVSHVVSRHEMLRTTISLGGGGFEATVHEPFHFRIPVHDLSGLPAVDQRRTLDAIRVRCQDRVFDVGRLPLLSMDAVRHADDEWTLVQVEHHVVHDGWSLGKLWGEVQAAYNALAAGKQPGLPALPAQYQQFVSWQRSRMTGAYGSKAVDFWCDYLDGEAEVSLGQPRGQANRLDGHNFETEVSAETFDELRDVAKQLAVSPFVLMFGAFAKLLATRTGERDFSVGTAVSARTETELEPIIGMVVNTIPVRVAVEESFAGVVRNVQRSLFKALRYSDVPLSLIVRKLGIAQQRGRNPVFQHCFSFHDSEVPKLVLGDAVGEVHEEQNQSAKFDVNVVVIPPGRTRSVRHARVFWQCSQNVFTRAEAVEFARDYDELLTAMLRESNSVAVG